MLDSKKVESRLDHVALLFLLLGGYAGLWVGGLLFFKQADTRYQQCLRRGQIDQ